MGWLADERGLEKRTANHVPLTPLSHLSRAAKLFPNVDAVIYGEQKYSYSLYHDRVTRLASALAANGIVPGDVVATLLPNIPAQVEAQFGVPAAGAILNTINIRLDSNTIAYILDHGQAKAIIVDSQFLPLAEEAIEKIEGEPPIIIEVADSVANIYASGKFPEYEIFLAAASPDFEWIMPKDEWESLALNYTSGTTGQPKGVVYHHRGAYLMAMGTATTWHMGLNPRYLTIVPLFHCNGWNHTWMIPILGGTIICCREITAKAIYDAIADHDVSYFGGAPIVLNTIVNSHPEERRPFEKTIEVFTAGAPPPAATMAAIEKMGFNVTHVYGLTETYGHVTECIWNEEAGRQMTDDEKAAFKSQQGVAFPIMEDITVVDDGMKQIPMDGKSQGEIVMRGNAVMKGYLKNPAATEKAFAGGYFHSEDIAVQHPNGYIQISDRAKDIIISGGENVSSVEVEGALMHHPAVSLCAVVGKPDQTWGEVPCAFVELKDDAAATEPELIAFLRERLAGFKTPKKVIFQELPKTSTGKIQKFELRLQAKAL